MDDFLRQALIKLAKISDEQLEAQRISDEAWDKVTLLKKSGHSLASWAKSELEAHPDSEAIKWLETIEAKRSASGRSAPVETATEPPPPADGRKKTQFLLDTWREHGGSVTPKELFALVEKTERAGQISLAHINNALSRWMTREMITKGDDKRYSLVSGAKTEE